MYYFDANGKQYPAVLDNKVFQLLKSVKKVDVFRNGFDLEDEDLKTWVGYEALRRAAHLNSEKLDISFEEFSETMSFKCQIQVTAAIMKEVSDALEAVNEILGKDEGQEEASGK